MMLEEGEIITLDTNGKEYIVLKQIINNDINYYYLMTTKKPVEVAIVKLLLTQNGVPVITTVTDKQELDVVLKSTESHFSKTN